jgi:hypothetical protein
MWICKKGFSTMERKSKAGIVISACCVVWGVLYFLFLRFFPYSLYNVIDFRILMSYTKEEVENLQQSLTLLHDLIKIGMWLLLIIFLVIKIITLKKNGYSFKDKSLVVYSTEFLIAALVVQFIGGRGVSWIFVIVSGIIGIIGSMKKIQ